jgi:hypothetical protein
VGFLLSPLEFSSHCHFYKLFCSWLLGVCRHTCLLQSLVVRDSPSTPFGAQGAQPSLLHVFFVVIAYYSVFFSFFSEWGSVCPGGYADLAQGCLWEYRIPLSSPCGLCLPKPSGRGPGALLVSPFNVKWRCYAQAGGMEESKFCLFWMVFPVRCISSISWRFYFRKHAFCFLPLAAILESLINIVF